jgi:hypothetical protein
LPSDLKYFQKVLQGVDVRWRGAQDKRGRPHKRARAADSLAVGAACTWVCCARARTRAVRAAVPAAARSQAGSTHDPQARCTHLPM